MKNRKLLRVLAAAALLVVPQIGWTVFDPVNDDTDIFLANPAFDAQRPNVLIFVDNTANWNTAFDTEKAALVSVINGLNSSYNVGYAMFVETGSPNDTVDGAYIRFGVRQMTDTNRTALSGMVNALDKNGDKGNNATYSLAMDEIYRYFSGTASYSGYGKVKRDYAGNSTYNSAAASLPGNAFASASSTTYVSPIVNGCQKNFIIFISNGPASDNSSSLSIAQSHLSTLVGKNPPDTISISPNGEQGLWADEYAKFMANSDCNASFDGVQNVITYTLDVLPGSSGQGPSHTALLKSMASAGKGKYFAIDDASSTTELITALKTIFAEVQEVNSVFASTTLPVSVNVRGTNLNQVYIGVFRPDAQKSPRWFGNLKLYRLGVNTADNSLFLADANGNAAENSSTGFITGSALSFWTTASTYWAFRDSTLNGIGGTSDSPDGDLVEKGGAAQQERIAYATDQSTRKLYTCVNSTHDGLCATNAALSATPFNSTNVTAADLGAFTTYKVISLTSSGNSATMVLSTTPNPAWAANDQIVVAGATPAIYNGTFTLASADNTTNTYTFSLPSSPSATGVDALQDNHGLQTGDLITVTGASSFDVTDAPITRLGNNEFTYNTGATVSGQATSVSAVAKKQLTSILGVAGNMTATAVVPGTSVYAAGDTISISGNAASQSFFDVANATVLTSSTDSVANTTTFTYTTSGVISGGGTSVQLTASAHNIGSNQTNVYIAGNGAAYDGGPLTSISVIDANNFTFASTQTSVGPASGVVGVKITNFSHPTSGGGNGTASCGARDVVTITTSGSHNISGPFPYAITIAGATGANTVYNGTWFIDSSANILNSTQFTINGASTSGAPSNSSHGGCSFDQGTVGATTALVVAGKPITSINPIVSATGSPLYASKAFTVATMTALTSASGIITAGRSADGDNTVRDDLIAWVRGADNNDFEDPDTAPTGVRPSIHGDVLHSRPAVVNYNRYGDDNDIYAFYGSNDGVFRAVKGGTATTTYTTGPDAGIKAGSERWGFIPREFFSKLKRLRDQSPTISSTNPKDYFADGSIAVYTKDVAGTGSVTSPGAGSVTGVFGDNSGDKVYLYITMHRGGDFIYALDVTDPANPKLLWRKGSSDAGWEQLGESWSEPQISRSHASLGNASNPDNVVLIFGAGYDTAVDDVNPCLLSTSTLTAEQQKAIGTGSVTYTSNGTCTISGATGSATNLSRTKGRGILVVDAFSGNVVWQASSTVTSSAASASDPTTAPRKLNVPDMTCAVATDVAVVDANRDNLGDRVYFGDMCGQVWRMDILSPNIDDWTVTKIAAISSATDTDIANKRKFMFPPDLVSGTDANGNYTAVLIGSGDREHPFDTTVVNRFYMFKDRDSADANSPHLGATNSTSVSITGISPTPSGNPLTDSDLFDATTTVVDSSQATSLNGWKVTLSAGEKVVSSSVTLSGTTFFNTNQPSAAAGGGACGSNLGIAREYQVGFSDASATVDVNGSGGIDLADRSTIHSGGGYLPSPVPVVVEIDGKRYQAVISGTSVQTPPGLTLEKRLRTYWYKEID